MKNLLYLIPLCILFSCSDNQPTQDKKGNTSILTEGNWLLEFSLAENVIAPTNFNLSKTDSLYEIIFSNASEKITVNRIVISDDKISIYDPVFNNWFEGKIVSPTKIEGFWFKNDTSYKVPFIASYGETTRFSAPENITETDVNINGKWEVDFSKNNPEDHYKAIGQFQQNGNKITGTFMTETGDYRFLEGNIYNNNFYLSCFDGAHLFLFEAELKNDSLIGRFWSGIRWNEPWVATRNNSIELTNPDSLTYLKEGFSELAFTFPNTENENISLADEQFKNKVVIVNIMGPWCPNCKDETAYLAELYNKNHSDGLEIIALAFDNSDDVNVTIKKLNKIKSHFNANYDFLIAGKASKTEAIKALPMLNHIMSYPTSIFIDKMGNIRKIRTGFYGPGTGDYYTRYIEKTNDFVAKLLAE